MSNENYVAIDREELARLRADSAELESIKVALKVEAEEKHEALMELRDLRTKPLQVPEGFALVPVEPTREMLVNVDEYVGGSCYSCSQSIATEDDCRRVWAAMLAAAPKGGSHE